MHTTIPWRAAPRRGRWRCFAIAGLLAWLTGGCTDPSLRLALQAQQRADDVAGFVFERQHEALRVLLYRDVLHRLGDAGTPLTDAQQTALNDAWNDRDLLEFWALQHERAKALRLAGVDAKLYSDQAPADLLIKSLLARADQVQTGLAAAAGATLGAGQTNDSAPQEVTPNGQQ
jgi:hypothetical protein